MTDRRRFLTTAAVGLGTLAIGCAGEQHASGEGPKGDEDDVTPAEDLMREHGVLRRVMFLYDEAAHRLDQPGEVPLDAIASAAGIIRTVIEDYHEKLEENFLFPRFEKAGKLVELTTTLRKQHVVGRIVTDQIVALANGKLAETDRGKLAKLLRSFDHMYRAHAAREDTVLFPALHSIIGKHEYGDLGEQFEQKETQMLGEHGFERAVEHVAQLEKRFGIDDLATLTAEV